MDEFNYTYRFVNDDDKLLQAEDIARSTFRGVSNDHSPFCVRQLDQ